MLLYGEDIGSRRERLRQCVVSYFT